MDFKSLINRCHPIPRFVYDDVVFREGARTIDVSIRPRRGSAPRCSNCGRKGSTYDTARVARSFTFVPLWGLSVLLWYCMRRVDCRHCGVKVERIPWASGKEQTCLVYQQFLAFWAKHLAWSAVARIFRTSWGVVFRSIRHVVEWGLKHRDLDNISAIGFDEIAVWAGHRYLTVVYQLDAGMRRLIWVGYGRSTVSCQAFFKFFGKKRTANLRFISSDMWRACINTVARFAPHVLHVLDRFHIVKRLNEAVDQVRRAEAKDLGKSGFSPLKNTRWCFLKRTENLTDSQFDKLIHVLKYAFRTVRAYLLKEAFDAFWAFRSPTHAGRFLDAWCRRAMRSRLPPIKTIAKSLRNHRDLILNWFRAKKEISQAVVEAMNGNAKLAIRKARGFRSWHTIRIALYHQLGKLPEPQVSTHRFW